MGESAVHLSMKAVVRRELEGDSFVVVEEPLFPPGRRLRWWRYRPDLLGFRRRGGEEEVVLVECETRPNMKRLSSKKDASVTFQSRLMATGRVRRILAVPQGRLGVVDLRIRSRWEVWVIGNRGLMKKISSL